MEQLLEMILTGAVRLPLFEAELFALDKALPKSDFLALLMLQRRGEATMSDLAGDLGTPLSTATGIGSRLERRGLIQRERHPQDKRVIVLQLTPEGEDLAERARTQINKLMTRVKSALTSEEMEVLIRLVQKVIMALQAGVPGGMAPNGTGLRRIPIDD